MLKFADFWKNKLQTLQIKNKIKGLECRVLASQSQGPPPKNKKTKKS